MYSVIYPSWELDITDILDAAYETEFATNVMTTPLRRTYLGMNVAQGNPIYEYRGGIYITPGCEIDGYTASLVCVTAAERARYPKDIQCNSGKIDCACISAAQSNAQPLILTKISSTGKITQGQPVDRTFSEVKENSAFAFDHLRVELLFSDATKKKNCLPDTNQDGVFYFPLTDITPFRRIGCDADPLSGELKCTSGIIKDFGFGNLKVNSVRFSPTTAVVGSPFKAYPKLTKTGSESLCLYWDVYRVDSASSKTKIRTGSIPIDYTYANSEYAQGIDVFEGNVPAIGTGSSTTGRVYNIEESLAGTATYSKDNYPIKGTISDITTPSTSADFTLFFQDGNGDCIIDCSGSDSYSYTKTGTPKILNSESCKSISDNSNKGIAIQFTSITIPDHYRSPIDNPSGTCGVKKVSLTSTYSGSGSATQATYSVVFVGGEKRNTTGCDGSYRFTTQEYPTSFIATTAAVSSTSSSSTSTVQTTASNGITVYDTSTNSQVTTSNTISGKSGLALSYTGKYQFRITKPSFTPTFKVRLNGVTLINEVSASNIGAVYTGSDYYYYELQMKDLSEGLESPVISTTNVYTLYIDVYKEDGTTLSETKTVDIYINPSEGGVAAGETCGPATGSETKGKCQSTACNPLTLGIANGDIPANNPRCASNLFCCKSS